MLLGMVPKDRATASFAVVSIAFGLAVTALVRSLALIRPLGTLLVVEIIRAVVLVAVTAGATWLLFRRRDPATRQHVPHAPGKAVAAGVGAVAGILGGAIAMSVGAIPDPTDSRDEVLWIFAGLVIVGGSIGFLLGPLLGLIVRPLAKRALERTSFRAGDALEGALGVSSVVVGAAGAIGGLLHARGGLVDPFTLASLVAAAATATVLVVRAKRRARWIESVARGEVPGWSIAAAPTGLTLPAWIAGGGESGVLMACAPGEGTFRTAPSQRGCPRSC